MRKPALLVVVGSLLVAGCGLSSSKPKSCARDADCSSGQGCREQAGDSYCAPLCTSDVQCPVQNQCPQSKDLPAAKCEDKGTHLDGKGVCDLYNGQFGPNTCK